ncbi:MAG: hypothetical protein ACREPB_07540, partial [Arenimonas sp.]
GAPTIGFVAWFGRSKQAPLRLVLSRGLGAASRRPYDWFCRVVWAQQACAPTVGVVRWFWV